MITPSRESTPDFGADIPLVSDDETFVPSGPEPKDKDEKKKFRTSERQREDEMKQRNWDRADRRDEREEVLETKVQEFRKDRDERAAAAKKKREDEEKKRKEDDERIRKAAEATAAQQTSGPSAGPLLRMPAEAEGVKSLRAYEKLSPQEQAAYKLGQQSMARPTPAPKASGSKKGKGKAKEASVPDPCTACIGAKAVKECVAQDAKNAVACNRCRTKKLQCSWRSSRGPDLSLVDIEEQLGRIADVQEETLAVTKRLVAAIEEANEMRRMKMEYRYPLFRLGSSGSKASKRKTVESEDDDMETEKEPVKKRRITRKDLDNGAGK
ncbi:hypothetical protein MPER_13051 [Moniliophthora perniciosa FA553]|nr:hypothetical protein MPER_13051 [Moniliophthora perniciosa FA553]